MSERLKAYGSVMTGGPLGILQWSERYDSHGPPEAVMVRIIMDLAS